jgi:arsenate reductase-like glutaredoxin family protein
MKQIIAFQGKILFQTFANSENELFTELNKSKLSQTDKEICKLILRTNKIRNCNPTIQELDAINCNFGNEIYKIINNL